MSSFAVKFQENSCWSVIIPKIFPKGSTTDLVTKLPFPPIWSGFCEKLGWNPLAYSTSRCISSSVIRLLIPAVYFVNLLSSFHLSQLRPSLQDNHVKPFFFC